MTVPGKGGRPRKWRSDADRVRAYRARQRGEQEPPTIHDDPAADDDAAIAWEQVRELGKMITAQRDELRDAHDELFGIQRELDLERGAYLVLEVAHSRLRAKIDTLTTDNDELRRSVTELRAQLAECRARRPSTAGPNRAQRRRAERDERRRHG